MINLAIVDKFRLPAIRKIAETFGFQLFIDNFEKNGGGFPYIPDDKVRFSVMLDGKKPAVIAAYGMPDGLGKMRVTHGELQFKDYAHLFDIEVGKDYRGKGLSKTMLQHVISNVRKSGAAGITLMAIDRRTAELYGKFGFKVYEDAQSPSMYLKF